MRILTTTQQTDEWHLARRGRVTASAIDKVLAGENMKGRHDYRLQLILDLEGVDDFRDSAPWFERGKRYEDRMLGWYEYEHGAVIEQTGFVLHDDYNWFGCSPDGLVNPNGCIEGKIRTTLERYEAAITKNVSRAYQYQMQAQMACLGRQWCDYVNYWFDEKTGQEQGHVRRIERDEGQIRELENAAMLFWRDVVKTYKSRTRREFIKYPFDHTKAVKRS